MIAFSIFGFHIYRYGVFYAVTFLLGYLYFFVLKKYSFFGTIAKGFYSLLKNNYEDILIYVIAGIIIGGRLGHIFIYDFAYYLHNPMHVFALWEGGMSFIGGIIGVVVSLLLLAWKYKFKKIDFFVLADVLLIPVSFGIMIGRIGNFLNQELYGIIVPSGWWNMGYVTFSILRDIHVFHVYSHVDQFLRVNTNLLASFFEGFCLLAVAVYLLVYQIRKKTRSIGLISSFFLMWYSGVRFLLEYIRADSQMEFVGLFSKSQWFFLIFFVIGLLLLIFRKKIFSYTIK